jgi:hypothetical protein
MTEGSGPSHRLETWLWSGPIGHFLGGTLDFAAALVHYLRAKRAGRAAR